MVTHPSGNQTWCTATTLTETNAVPPNQTVAHFCTFQLRRIQQFSLQWLVKATFRPQLVTTTLLKTRAAPFNYWYPESSSTQLKCFPHHMLHTYVSPHLEKWFLGTEAEASNMSFIQLMNRQNQARWCEADKYKTFQQSLRKSFPLNVNTFSATVDWTH